jgi:hypothetical protein
MANAIPGNARSMSENAREAAKLIAKEQQKIPGKKVRVVAIKEGGFDGFKWREPGEQFIAWWPDYLEVDDVKDGVVVGKKKIKCRPPSWQQPVKEFEKEQKAAEQAELDADGVTE